jgi:hypothetical protein
LGRGLGFWYVIGDDVVDMNIEIISRIDDNLQRNIWRLVTVIDKEFIPPLSSRTSTTQTDFSQSLNSDKGELENYYLKLLEQNVIIYQNYVKYKNKLSFNI